MQRLAISLLVVALLTACGDDDAVTTSTTATTIATTTTAAAATTTLSEPSTTTVAPAAELVLPFVDDFDATTTMTPLYFAEWFNFEYLEGGIVRITRDPGFGEGGMALYGAYPGTHGDGIEISLTFLNTTPENQTDRGVFLLSDAEITQFVGVGVNPVGNVTIYPIIDDYPHDYVSLDGSSVYVADDFNTLVVRLQGGSLTVQLNGAVLGGIEGLPVASGTLGVYVSTNAPGEAVELARFSVTAIP